MGLKQNGFRDSMGSVAFYGAAVSNNGYPSSDWGNKCLTGAIRNITAGQGITDGTVSLPSGNRHPNVWMQPQKSGALASRNAIVGNGNISAAVLAVKLALADIGGDGTISNATGGLIVQALAAITGSGTIAGANLQAFLAAVAALTGSGDAEGTAVGYGAILAALTGSGEADATLPAFGEMNADLTVTGTGLSSANVGQFVWSYLIENGLSAEQVQRLLLAVAAGDATGLEGTNPVFKAQDGTTTRIDATYSSGTRTIDSINGD